MLIIITSTLLTLATMVLALAFALNGFIIAAFVALFLTFLVFSTTFALMFTSGI